MTERNSGASLRAIVCIPAAALLLAVACVQPASAKDPYDKLIAQAKAEMEAHGGKIRMNLDWPEDDTKAVFPAFLKEFPFVKSIDYFRETGIGPFGRYLIAIKQNEFPPYDVMHVAGEFQQQYLAAGALVKPPFDYRELNASLPDGWPKVIDEAFDKDGNFLATGGLVRGNVWNTRLVPDAKAPKTWADCAKAEWKGKAMVDARNKLQAFHYDQKERPRHLAWLTDLQKNDVVVIDGQGPIMQKVASGEFPIACGVNYHTAQRSIDGGMKGVQFGVPDSVPLELGTRMYVVKWSKMPATTQLFSIWLASAGQEILDKTAYRGFPTNPQNRNYPNAKGKYIAVCGAECTARIGEFDKEYEAALKIPSAK
jgi:ABC-type Fe3+ transport system substrate-binding protein